jgi:hypothetical protein
VQKVSSEVSFPLVTIIYLREKGWEKENRTREGGRATFWISLRVALSSFCATARNDAVVEAHFGHVDQRPKIDPRTVSRLVK